MKVSIIIPCLNEAPFLPNTIENCLGLEGDFEIIVIDGGSRDQTETVARSYDNVKFFRSPKGRSLQMNYGAKKAQGSVLLFLHADTLLPADAYLLIKKRLQKKGHIGGSFRLKLDTPHPFLKLYTWCSRFSLEFFTYGDHGIFIKKEVFEEIGGFREIPLMEDIEIQKRLRKKGKFKKLSKYVITSGRRFEKNGTVKQLIIDVLLVALYNIKVPPAKLKRFYSDHC
ncbi:glycosyltransferase [Christiangramia fulva]|uniref:Glycosyltransferase n=1 Tax=Christiangramia fulva TaxID=2126553 RepID=A0A2R3Z4B3_9FLAO|nr:TIGR04283 family arsenosugar biosynthesis glycosyltransferase [Christiangramia fulva]AVR45099.1 glycosyltransferase [Christiangramia fulva]